MSLLFNWSGSNRLRWCRSWLIGCSTGGWNVFDGIVGGTFTRLDRQGRNQAQNNKCACEDPGAFFKYIGGLFNTHELVAETCNVACQSAAFWILDQYNGSEQHRGEDDEGYEKGSRNLKSLS